MLKDLVKKCRSYRRFFQEVSIPYEDLKDMVDTARLTGCTKNCQGLKFKLISTPEECAKVFPSLLWAGALKGLGRTCRWRTSKCLCAGT